MKSIKKIFTLLMAVVMTLGLSVTAFAAQDNHTYELYQIFTGDFANNVLSNVKWGENAKPTNGAAVGDLVPDTVLKELTDLNSKSDAEKLDVIKKYVNLESAPMSVTLTRNADGSVTCSGLATGYYLIKDKKDSVTGNDVYTTYVVRVTDGTLTFTRKGDVPEVEKKIVEDNNSKVETNEASIGDTIHFEITGTLPTNFDDYKEYTYVFTDTLSKGLTYNEGSVEVKVVNGSTEVDVTKYFYIHAEKNPTSGETTLQVGISDLQALNNIGGVTVNSGSEIVVTYSATLNKDAVIAGDGNDNSVKLAYSNDPNNSGDGTTTPPPEKPDMPDMPAGETPESTTTTYITELTILKHDGNGDILTGAEFTLTGNGVNITVITGEVYVLDENGTYWKLKDGTYTTTAPVIGGDKDNQDAYESVTEKYSKKTEATVVPGTGTPDKSVSAYVDAEGKVTFSGLGAGTYTITETKTPDGYNTIAPITFTLTFDAESKTFVSNNSSIVVGEDNKLDITIVNRSGSELPSTGGVGTTIFYVLGAILVLGAGILLVVRRRMNAEK